MSEAERGANVRFPPPLIYAIWIVVAVGIYYGVARTPLPFDRSVGITGGVILVVIAVAIIASAFSLFKRTGQDPAPCAPSPELILQGPYRFTRNPMYVGLTLLQVGVGLGFNNLWIALFAPLSLLTTHFVAVLPEERYLSEKFGDSYKTYLTRVRRYI